MQWVPKCTPFSRGRDAVPLRHRWNRDGGNTPRIWLPDRGMALSRSLRDRLRRCCWRRRRAPALQGHLSTSYLALRCCSHPPFPEEMLRSRVLLYCVVLLAGSSSPLSAQSAHSAGITLASGTVPVVCRSDERPAPCSLRQVPPVDVASVAPVPGKRAITGALIGGAIGGFLELHVGEGAVAPEPRTGRWFVHGALSI